jgi:hypothetical protein
LTFGEILFKRTDQRPMVLSDTVNLADGRRVKASSTVKSMVQIASSTKNMTLSSFRVVSLTSPSDRM